MSLDHILHILFLIINLPVTEILLPLRPCRARLLVIASLPKKNEHVESIISTHTSLPLSFGRKIQSISFVPAANVFFQI